MYLLLLVIALIIHGSLYPWHFEWAGGATNPWQVLLNSWPSKFDSAARSDALLNIAFYFPLGAAAFLASARAWTRTAAAAITLALGFTLSCALEMIQVYVPGRVCSLGDVACNVGGAALGLVAVLVLHGPAENLYQSLARRFRPHFAYPATLLLVCWTVYQLFPFTPQYRPWSLEWEMGFLRHPDNLFPAEIWTNVAEWFAVILIVRSMAGYVRIRWFIAAVGFRIAIRPLLLTRGFALDELLGVTLALLVWTALGESWRLRAGISMLVAAILLRQLTSVQFSHLPSYLGPGGVVFRRGFDYGALGLMLSRCRWRRTSATAAGT
ncbi:MAG: VanZ family protein [Acidobacteriota bacterium]|nr:VanZ family protein [Acidobacteriota bacterium]